MLKKRWKTLFIIIIIIIITIILFILRVHLSAVGVLVVSNLPKQIIRQLSPVSAVLMNRKVKIIQCVSMIIV